jgi:prepilin-type processing-associated H-X9-DG protein
LEQNSLFATFNINGPIPPCSTLVKTFVCPSDVVPANFIMRNKANTSDLQAAPPSSYAACVGTSAAAQSILPGNGVFYCNSSVRLTDITDGTSNTLFVAERSFGLVKGTWIGAIPGAGANQGDSNPNANLTNPAGQSPGDLVLVGSSTVNSPSGRNLDESTSRHTGGANMLFGDGSVHFIRNVPTKGSADSVILGGLATISGGEPLNTDLW